MEIKTISFHNLKLLLVSREKKKPASEFEWRGGSECWPGTKEGTLRRGGEAQHKSN